MGAANSSTSSSRSPSVDGITTVSERLEGSDPIAERLRSLKIVSPLSKPSPPTESTLTEILVRKPTTSSSSISGNLNSKVLLELFSLYRDWLEKETAKVSHKQEEIENKIELADALAAKLLQRYNYSVSAMRTAAQNLSQVHSLQVDVGELKGRLTEVINNCDTLCKRIAAEPTLLESSKQPIPSKDVQVDHTSLQETPSPGP